MAVVGANPHRITILLNNGVGGFSAVSGIVPGASGPTSVASADFNQDSHRDVVVGYIAGFAVSVLSGDGSGSFVAATDYTVGAAPSFVATGDPNSDGKPDVLAAVNEPASVAVLLSTGSGFAPLIRTSMAAAPFTVGVDDLDEDGDPDLAAAVYGGLLTAHGDGSGLFGAATHTLPVPYAGAVVIADINRDGKKDVVSAGEADVRVFLGDGRGGFGAPVVSPAYWSVSALAIGRFNDDPHLDLIRIAGQSAFVMLGDGAGSFALPSQITITSGFANAAPAIANFNADDDLDLAIGTTGGIEIFFGDGRGAFSAGPIINGGGSSSSSVVTSDFNGDGHPDLVRGLMSSEVLFVPGAPGGTFGLPRLFPAGYSVSDVAVGDFNGDAKLDVVVAHDTSTGGLSILPGLGNGTFGAPSYSPGSAMNRSLIVADLNLDGEEDVASISSFTGTTSVFLGNGTGGLILDRSWWNGGKPSGIAVGKLDCDSKDDLVVSSDTAGEVSVLLNTCGGGAGPPTVTGIQPSSGADAGGTAVTITGTNFRAGATVEIGGVPATDIVVSSFGVITARTGPRAPGTVDVVVTNPPVPCVTAPAVLVGGFTYLPRLAIAAASVTEGSSGMVNASLPVTLSAATAQTVTVSYATSDETATAPADYAAVSGVLTFSPGTTLRTVSVAVAGDLLDEPNERFRVTLGSPVQALVASGQADGLILDDDGATISVTELTHGHVVVGELAAQPGPLAAQDLYLMSQRGRSSYEVVIDASSGGAGGPSGPVVQRVLPDLTTVVQESVAIGTGPARSLRWQNSSAGDASTQYIRVRSGGCTTACDASASYRIRAYETTASLPRFNNSGSQTTVLVLHNRSSGPLSGSVWFWDASGSLVGTQALSISGRASFVLATAGVAPGVGGSLTVTHDGPYGVLVGKAVAIEPASGFSFDSPLQLRTK